MEIEEIEQPPVEDITIKEYEEEDDPAEHDNEGELSDPNHDDDDGDDSDTPLKDEQSKELFTSPSITSKSVINEEGIKQRRYFCEICDKSYVRTDKLRVHLKNTHGITCAPKHRKNPAKDTTCNWCGKMFSYMAKLDKHLLTHGPQPFTCNICPDKQFATRNELTEHQVDVHYVSPAYLDRPFVCSQCDKGFGRFEQLRKHVEKHPEVDPASILSKFEADDKAKFSCPICERSYTRVEKLDMHMFTHDNVPFHCDFCDEGFTSRRDQKYHQDVCEAETVLIPCSQCDRLFISQRLLALHMDEHNEQTFPCTICGTCFDTRITLNQHCRTKHDKPFQCTECGKQLSRQDKLDDHMKKHSGYPCRDCNQKFKTRRELKKHEEVHEASQATSLDATTTSPNKSDAAVRFHCEECRTSYRTEEKLTDHMKDCHDAMGYPCDQCELTFDSKTKMKAHSYKHNAKLCGICGVWISNSFGAHMRRHEGDKPFKCPVAGCDKRFLRNCDLTSHKKVHTGEKPFACDFPNCNMRFARPYRVALHKRTHTGEKPYKCDYKGCQREFTQSFDLTLHMRRHTGEKPYECEKCRERFILASLLKKHQQTCPGEQSHDVITIPVSAQDSTQIPVAVQIPVLSQAMSTSLQQSVVKEEYIMF